MLDNKGLQMKKIGILTFWGVPNYGAFAQAYALNKVISSMIPDSLVVDLAYLHPKHKELYFYKKMPQMTSPKQLITPSFYKQWINYLTNRKIEYPKFAIDWNSIPHVDLENEVQLENYSCDIIVTGSDAIWEYSISDFGDDAHLIGNRLNCFKLIAYAASFGDMDESNFFADFIPQGLNNYELIAVRDQTSKNIVRKLIGEKPIEIVLDPSLLYDFKNDKEIPGSIYSDYILVYGNDFPDNLINDVKAYAKQNQLILIGAGIAPEWCDICLSEIGPKEWIGLFRDARVVVTCTFHGLMFSINFEKKVIFNQVDYVKNRSEYLLESLGLSHLYTKDGEAILKKVLDFQWDYGDINAKLGKMREKSMAYLRRGLQDEEH